jgi:hypothetical protein
MAGKEEVIGLRDLGRVRGARYGGKEKEGCNRVKNLWAEA